MRLTIRFLGLELFTLEASTDDTPDDGAELAGGTTSAMPMGFTPTPGDQRWEKAPELE